MGSEAAAVRRAHGSAASGAATACGAVCTPSFFTAPSVKAGADGQDHQPGDGEEGEEGGESKTGPATYMHACSYWNAARVHDPCMHAGM